MTLKVAVIGLGRVGARWEYEDPVRLKPATHVGAWKRTEGVELDGICEIDETLRREVAKRYGVLGYEHYPSMLAREQFDIVSVATPASTHCEIVKYIAAKKLAKLIFCEKPLAPTVQEARDMVETCAARGVTLAVNHTRRWDPIYKQAAKTLKKERYGPVAGYAVAFSGDWLEVGTHMADLVLWYGLPLGAGRGALVRPSVPYLVFEVMIFCENGTIQIPRGYGEYELKAEPSPRYGGVLETMSDAQTKGDGKTPMLHATEQLRDCVTKNLKPACTGEDGLAAVELAVSWMRSPP